MANNHNREESASNNAPPLRDVQTGNAKIEACSICLESITDRAVTVPCNHTSFDFLCLASWVQDHPSCPLCKTDLTAIEYEWASPDDYETFRIPERSREGQDGHTTLNIPRRPRVSQQFRKRRPDHRPTQLACITERMAIDRRRHVYKHMLFSYHVGANRTSQFREFTPQTFAHSKDLQVKARKWIRRELQVFEFLVPSTDDSSNRDDVQGRRRFAGNTEFVLEYIVSVLKTVDVKDATGKAESMIADFLRPAQARLFLHELEAWLRSPYTELEAWDRHVQYPEPTCGR